jgi:hypothetical protein
MRYQLESVLTQVKHLKMAQVKESGSVEEWVFPLEKELVRALESLRVKGSQKAPVKEKPQVSHLVMAEEMVEVLESEKGWE